MSTAPKTMQVHKRSTVPVIIIGAGQAGLAMSRCLSEYGIDHAILERGEVANSWRKERWDSLRVLSPNWMTRLPGHHYQGNDPDGFMTARQLAGYLDDYAEKILAPVYSGVTVTSVSQCDEGYRVITNEGEWRCLSLVMASGACNIPLAPRFAAAVPDSVQTLNPMQYRNPEQLADGGVLVVGASATGLQLAEEIHQTGRPVTIAVGEHVRLPRSYRGRDICWWMEKCGLFDLGHEHVDDINRARRLPSMQLVGSPEKRDLNLNRMQAAGVEVVGRMSAIQDGVAQFSGSLANVSKMADLKMHRLLRLIDGWIAERGMNAYLPKADQVMPTALGNAPRLSVDLHSNEFKTIIWATGYRPDYSWLNVPVLNNKGLLRHHGGIVDAPGLYAMGLLFMRRRKSNFIDGVADDARDLSAHISTYLDKHWQQKLMSVA